MIYVDSSVALAYLLAEDKRPPDRLWQETLISSRLLQYEIATRLNNLRARPAAQDSARALLGHIAVVELIPEVVARVREPFPVPVRTLDALHLASASFLLNEGVALELASYDGRMLDAAKKLKIPLYRGLR